MRHKKRAIFAIMIALAFSWANGSHAHSGAGAVTAMKNGDFVIRYFGGTQAGIDSAVVYCTPGGTVSLGPGLEALAPSVTVPSTVLVLRTGSTGWTMLGNGATARLPRLGAASTTTSGGAVRVVEGVTFPLTVAGVQAAINECAAVDGGTVWVPTNANILLGTTPIILKNKVLLRAYGSQTHAAASVFRGDASTNVKFAIVNSDTTGGQHYAALDGITIDGNMATGARIDAGIYFKELFVGSRIDNCRITEVSGRGIVLAGINAGAFGSFLLQNTIVGDTGDNNILITAGMRNVVLRHVECDRPGRNTAAVKIDGTTTTSAGSIGVKIDGLYTEVQDSMSVGVLMDGASAVHVNDYSAVIPSGRFRAAIQVKNTTPGNFGFSPSGLTVTSLYSESDTLIENQYTGEIITTGADPNNPYRHVSWYTSAISKGSVSTNGYRNSAMIIGLDQAKLGPDIASASTIAPHPDGSDFNITGTTTITGVTGHASFLHRTICFWTAAALQFTDGGNLNLNANFVGNGTGGKDCLCGKWDGTNWNEVSRSLN